MQLLVSISFEQLMPAVKFHEGDAMTTKRRLFFATACLLSSFISASAADSQSNQPVAAAVAVASSREWAIFGDQRHRLESDWDSRRPDGTLRDDRDRYRIRARLGVEWKPTENWMLRVRVRTGSHLRQQSSNLTLHDFDGGPNDDFDAVLDEWFVRGKFDRFSLWAGRNDFPFFYAAESQEMVWDNDPTLTGGFVSWKATDLLTVNVGVFALPDGMDRWNGALWAGQVVGRKKVRAGWTLKGAASFLDIEGGGQSDRLPDGNGSRDYRIGILSAQSLWTLEQNPLRLGYCRLGVDGMRNFSDYSSTDSDPVTARYHNATDGLVAAFAVGKVKPDNRERGDWELEYAYGHVEKLAVNASYAQDDWVRWGTGGQATATDLKGHHVGLRAWLWKDKHHTLDLRARTYFAASLSSVEDGNRFRLDLNYSFKL
ncbi:MAG TPA: putative porin [Gemmatimonadaceae bacterium]|nr:putative porin [Gemmatimonadaceae bacterium]